MLKLKDFDLLKLTFADSQKIFGGDSYSICYETTWAFDTFDKSYTKYDDSGNFMTGWSELIEPNPDDSEGPIA
ncbi:MAG TPA: hypothetical protein PKD85_22095 [Saprospiraceae bacterium]|nr:hypothetical protein [Saprospiraceae bacterium]